MKKQMGKKMARQSKLEDFRYQSGYEDEHLHIPKSPGRHFASDRIFTPEYQGRVELTA